jgi:hypothetical protein
VGKLATKSAKSASAEPLFLREKLSRFITPPLVITATTSLEAKSFPPCADNSHLAANSITTTTAKPKARQNSAKSREQRRVEKDRRANFEAAARFAYQMDWPLNLAITVNWTCLIQAGDQNEGHCLGRDEAGREAYFRAELSRCRPKTTPKTPFVAIWGRDIGSKMGSHTHLAVFWPRWHKNHPSALIELLERITGSQVAPYEETNGHHVIAESACKGWQIKTVYGRDLLAGALAWVDYIARQSDKHTAQPGILGKAFGISQAIGPKARAACRKGLCGGR